MRLPAVARSGRGPRRCRGFRRCPANGSVPRPRPAGATQPVTAGLAMLVPDFAVGPVFDSEAAATTSCPGAETSGLSRPSRVGPALENQESGVAGLCASYEPTTIDF